MSKGYKTIELHRIEGGCRPIIATVYLITGSEKSVQFTLHLSSEEFCEHIFKNMMTGLGGIDIMFDRLFQLYQIQKRETEDVSKKLIKSINPIADEPHEDDEQT